MENSNIKKTLLYFAGNFSSKIFSMLIIPIYATFLTANELGKFDYQQTIANLLWPVIALALWESVLRFGLDADDLKLKSIFSTTIVITSVTVSFSFIVLIYIYIKIYGMYLVSWLYVLMIVLMPVTTIFGYMARALGKTAVFAFSGLISSVINLINIIIFVIVFKMGLLGLLVSTIIANLCNIVFLIIGGKVKPYISIKYFSLEEGKRLLAYSTPLILNLMFGWVVSSFSRVFINQAIGSTENGIYAFASKFSSILLQIATIINMTMIEDAIQSAGREDWTVRFEKNISFITNIFFRISVVIIPLIGIYYQTISNADFLKSLILVPFLIFATILTNISTLIGNIFLVFNKNAKIFTTTLLGGLINVVFAFFLYKPFGILGVVMAQVLGSFVLVFSRYILGKKIKNYFFDWLSFIGNTSFLLIVSVVTLTRIIWFQLAIFMMTAGLFSFLYRNEIKSVIKRYYK